MTEATFVLAADWDGAWKDAVAALLRWFLAMFFPQVRGEIDWSRGFEALDKQQVAGRACFSTRRLPLRVGRRRQDAC